MSYYVSEVGQAFDETLDWYMYAWSATAYNEALLTRRVRALIFADEDDWICNWISRVPLRFSLFFAWTDSCGSRSRADTFHDADGKREDDSCVGVATARGLSRPAAPALGRWGRESRRGAQWWPNDVRNRTAVQTIL